MRQAALALRTQTAVSVLDKIREDRKRVDKDIQTLLDLIHTRLFDSDFDANALWRENQISKGSNSSRFSRQVGTTPADYIWDHRMKVAALLLLNPEFKIHEVAILVAYHETSDSFCKAFKRWSGYTPSAFAKSPDAQELRRRQASRACQLLEQVDHARQSDDPKTARQKLALLDGLLLDEEIRKQAAELAGNCHQQGVLRARVGEVDRAFQDLTLARRCYEEAGELLPPDLASHPYHEGKSTISFLAIPIL